MISRDAREDMEFERRLQEAEDCLARGEHRVAFDRYIALLHERLTVIGTTLALRATDAVIVERLADLAVLFGNRAAAVDLLSALVVAYAAVGNVASADYTRIKLAGVHFADRQLVRARDILESLDGATLDHRTFDASPQALLAWEAGAWRFASSDDRAVLLTRLYLEVGQLLAATGQYVACLDIVARGLARCSADAPPMARRARANLRLLAARAALERGDLTGAESRLADAAADDGETTRLIRDIHRIELDAKLSLLRGQFGRAKSRLERVIELCRRGGFQAARMRATLNLAQALILLNQTRAASDLLVQVRAGASEMHDPATLARANTLSQMAIARVQSLADAVAITPSVSEHWDAPVVGARTSTAMSISTEPNAAIATSWLTRFEDRTLLVYWAFGQRDWAVAERLLLELQAVYGRSDSMLIAARLLALHGMLAYYWSDWTGADEGLTEASAAFDKLGVKPDLWQCQRFLAWASRQRGDAECADELVRQSERLLEQMTSSLDAQDRAIFSLNKWTADEEFLAASITTLAKIAAERPRWWPVRAVAQWRLQQRLLAMINHLDRHQRQVSAHVLRAGRGDRGETRLETRPRRWWRERRDTATIGYLVLPDRLLVVCWCGWTGRFAVRTVSRLALREMVAELHRTMAAEGSLGDVEHLTSVLAEALGLETLLDGLPSRVTSLRIIADDSLRGVPFAALPVGGRGAILAQRFTLVTGFEWFPATRPRSRGGEALVAGVAQALGHFPALRQVESEVTFVARWFESRRIATTVLQDDQASRANVSSRLPTITYLHLACHGVFQPDAPDRSGLLLSNHGLPERLSVADLVASDLRHLELATLSACWAADSFVLPGRYVICLPYALWTAGARTVLAPLWQVDDQIASPFIQRFYEHLATQSPAHALRATQLDALSNTLAVADSSRQTTHPVHWAAYQLFGSPNGADRS